ncbi:RidA family protein [Streptomyces sp. HNM0574]|uniref:RidA family protein n=1 Tax=Streptomyces sp. HNM0574 TaxID=2714954 RepID=UPI00146D5D14|nr:RidA family protein [Streptomyces sp. HNM0574]NLU66030.1 RidA family protein [Streptomyces sp. HNM0574]
MPELTHLTSPSGLPQGNGYSHVVLGEGRFVALSGQISLDADGAVVGAGDPEAQARQVFANLDRCLSAAGAGWSDVVKLTLFTTDIAHLPAVRVARDAYIDTAAPPASSAVQVSGLIHPDLVLEVEAYALLPRT